MEIFEAKSAMQVKKLGDPFGTISIVMHQNGNVEECGIIPPSNQTLQAIYDSIDSDQLPIKSGHSKSKYHSDAILTTALDSLLASHQCAGIDKKKSKLMKDDSWLSSQTTASESHPLLTYCDMGEEYTPKLPDHDKLVQMNIGDESVVPCHFHTREGLQISSLEQLANLARERSNQPECSSSSEGEEENTCSTPEFHLYAVPAGRVFMFSPSYVGEIFDLPHATVEPHKPVSLEVISLSPRVFDIKNFFSLEESNAIVEKALHETSETHRIKASSTGASGYNLNSKRTSENGFDTHGKQAISVKQ